MLTKFNMVRDINGYNGFGLKFSNSQFQALVASGVESTLEVPVSPDATYPNLIAIFSFSPGSSVWVSLNQSATIPISGTFSQCNCELNPSARFVQTGDILSFISDDSTNEIGVSFYAIA